MNLMFNLITAGNGGNAGGDGKSAHGDTSQRSPSTGMSTISFQNSAQMYNGAGAGKAGGVPLTLKFGRQEGVAGISAAQFAASTGGLTMDTALLARVSGTDPSLMGTEEIKQIMRTPDLLSIYQKLQEEDDRRQRRYVFTPRCAYEVFQKPFAEMAVPEADELLRCSIGWSAIVHRLVCVERRRRAWWRRTKGRFPSSRTR